jgi:hypothetical protein
MIKPELKKLFLKHWRLPAILLLASVFFIAVGSFNYFTQSYAKDAVKLDFVKWTSPDETANYVFSKLYGQTGKLVIDEKYNFTTKDIMHPRSFRSDNGEIKPVSFLGLVLIYGKIASFLGYKVLPYLTPFFAAIGIVFFYFLVKEFFGKTNALISAILLAGFPPYLYYSARSMFHNVLFVVLLVVGLYFSVLMARRPGDKKKFLAMNIWNKDLLWFLYSALAGFFIGLTVTTRASELIWLLPMFFILWLSNLRKISFAKILIFFCFFIVAVIPALSYNKILYGSYFFGGYNEMNQTIERITKAGTSFLETAVIGSPRQGDGVISTVKTGVFHFGVHPKDSLKMLYYYFVKMFPLLFWPAMLGVFAFFLNFRKVKLGHVAYLSAFFVSASILILYYGSWEFHDNPDPKQFTIGNSYTRYWLPVYLALIPFASYFIIKLTWALGALFRIPLKRGLAEKDYYKKWISRKFFANSLRTIIVAVILFISAGFILYGSDEGLIFTARRQLESKIEWQKLIASTESNSAIITMYHDKLVFPERKVIVGNFTDQNMVAEYKNLVKFIPVYYYNFRFPERDFEYLNSRRLKDFGLQIYEVKKITEDFTLYRLSAVVESAIEATSSAVAEGKNK